MNEPRPNIYTIKTNTNNASSLEDVQDIYKTIDKLQQDALNQAYLADCKATGLKFVYVLGSIFITVAGAVIAVLSIVTDGNFVTNNNTTVNKYNGTQITNIVLGFCVTIFKSLLALFMIEKRSYMFKDVSLKLKKISRNVGELRSLDLSNQELIKKVGEFYAEMDDLDIYMFSNGAGSTVPADKSPKLLNNPTDTVVTI